MTPKLKTQRIQLNFVNFLGIRSNGRLVYPEVSAALKFFPAFALHENTQNLQAKYRVCNLAQRIVFGSNLFSAFALIYRKYLIQHVHP